MNYAVEMGSDAIMRIPNFIKIGSGSQKLIAGIHRHTESMMIPKGYFYFIKIRKAGYRLKRAFFIHIYTYRVKKGGRDEMFVRVRSTNHYINFRNLCLKLQINKYMSPLKIAH
jgi:hypothetical protein